MHRKAMGKLIEWKNNPNRKPLILRGARQVGKTWLVEEFGKREFKNTLVVNLESRTMHEAFQDVTEPEKILRILSIKSGRDADGSTLLFLDEIQECPDALASLKYFAEKMPGAYVIAAGSLLGVSTGQRRTFPVGKVEMLTLLPMDFEEFLMATGNGRMAAVIEAYDTDVMAGLAPELSEQLRNYICIGGMPEAVKEYAESGDFNRVRKVQNALVGAYENDMGKHPPTSDIANMRAVWNSVPGQLSKDNGRKFTYGLLDRKGGAAVYMSPIQWLCDYGLLNMVPRISKPGVPLSAYTDRKAFKLFTLDVGILCAKSGIEPKAVVEGDRLFTEFRGALAEQYVVQELIASDHSLYCWKAEKSDGEVDLVTECSGTPAPIEVKASENLRSKSLRSFRDRYDIGLSVRTSLSGTRDEGWLLNIPLYAIGRLDEAVRRHSGRNV